MKRQDLDLVRGSIDTHAHTAPALFPRHIDDADLAELALEYGIKDEGDKQPPSHREMLGAPVQAHPAIVE